MGTYEEGVITVPGTQKTPKISSNNSRTPNVLCYGSQVSLALNSFVYRVPVLFREKLCLKKQNHIDISKAARYTAKSPTRRSEAPSPISVWAGTDRPGPPGLQRTPMSHGTARASKVVCANAL